jgi:hypothetical protein
MKVHKCVRVDVTSVHVDAKKKNNFFKIKFFFFFRVRAEKTSIRADALRRLRRWGKFLFLFFFYVRTDGKKEKECMFFSFFSFSGSAQTEFYRARM